MSAHPLESILKRLDTYPLLETNWDSYGGLPTTEAVIATARKLLYDIYQAHQAARQRHKPTSPWYDVAPTSGGGVYFEWRSQDQGIVIELDIGADGLFNGFLLIVAEPGNLRREYWRWWVEAETSSALLILIFDLIAVVIRDPTRRYP